MKPAPVIQHNKWDEDPGARWYETRYRARSGEHYGDEIWAANYQDAKNTCRLRGLSESIDSYLHTNPKRFPYPLPSEILHRRPSRWDWQAMIHGATHITHLALAAGHDRPVDLLDDQSPLHELIHLKMWMEDPDTRNSYTTRELRKELIYQFFQLERSIPGLRPPIELTTY